MLESGSNETQQAIHAYKCKRFLLEANYVSNMLLYIKVYRISFVKSI